MNHHLDKCDALLRCPALDKGTREFVRSIRDCIIEFPENYPTEKQAFWLNRLYQEHVAKQEDVIPAGISKVTWTPYQEAGA